MPAADGTVAKVVLFEPLLYMNRSGEAVKGLVEYYKTSHQDVLVVLDDMALPLGKLRLRASGSAGGHNGLDDVLKLLGTQDVPRLRVGVGASPPEMDPADYVLSPFAASEKEIIDQVIGRAAKAVEDWMERDIEQVMEEYNRKADA